MPELSLVQGNAERRIDPPVVDDRIWLTMSARRLIARCRMVGLFARHGLAAAFESVGFSEVARGFETRPIMRLTID